jgi:lipopolysaccharide assembly outer membrane protein LptD (OstA)
LLSNKVTMAQHQRRVSADHGVIEERTALFYGDARMADALARSESEELLLEREPRRATLRGSSHSPVRMEYATPDQGAAQMAGPAGAPPAPETPQPARARAQKAVVEEQSHQVTLSGQVWVEIPEKQIQMQAENVVLQFGEDNSVTGFQARGDVVIIQPGRRLTSDSARSQNRMQTILLQGRARAQQEGQFELTSERMEVFTDPKKGAVRSEDRQRPITTALDLAATRPLRLDQARLQALIEKGVPPETVQKLAPLAGHTFAGQDALRKAASELLTPEESQRYLPLVIAQAR